MYALGRDTSAVFLLQLEKGGAVQSVESFSATSTSSDDVFIVRGELGICYEKQTLGGCRGVAGRS